MVRNAFSTRRGFSIAPDTALLCVTIVVVPELFGGAFPWTVVATAALSVTCLGTAIWVRRAERQPVLDGLLIVMITAWLWTCLQAVPLPPGVARALGLGSAQTAERLEGLAWADTVPYTISYDPGSTHQQILIGVAIVSAFLAARLVGPSQLRPIAIATVGSAVLMSLVGFAHVVVGANEVFGTYEPRFAAAHLMAPLMNGNHLGGFCQMGALIAAGLAAGERRLPRRAAWVLASALCAVAVAWTLSRGAIGALLFGFVLLVAWLFSGKRTGSQRRGAVIPLAALGAAVVGVVAFAGLEPILRRFETQGYDKLEVAARSLRLLDGPAVWLGVGRGAFSSAFVAYEGSLDRYTHPENLLVQWTTEWGVVVAALLLLVLGWAIWKRFRSAERPLIASVCIAVFALSLQNLVDFSLEMAGVVVVVAALLGALLPTRCALSRERSSRPLLASAVVFAVLVAGLGPRVLANDTQSIVDRLSDAMEVGDDEAFRSTLRRGLALHPNEPGIALLAATYAGSIRHPDAARWLSVAMEEAPGWAAPHAVAARWLLGASQTDQALVEIREAEQRHAGSGQKALCEVLTRFPELEYVERAAPGEFRRIAYLNRTASYCTELSPELRAQIDAAILEEEPAHPAALLREARRLVSTERAVEAIALLQQAVDQNPDNGSVWVALIRATLSAGDPERARSTLQEVTARGLHDRGLLEARARVEAALGNGEAMRATLTRLRGQAQGDARLIGRAFMLGAELEASLGNIDRALDAYDAADTASSDLPALRHAAALALKSGRSSHALRAYRTLCERNPAGPACAHEARLAGEARTRPHP